MADEGLQVDTAALREVGAALARLQVDLEAAPAVAQVPAQVLAHDALRERLHHVGAGWDRRRLATAAALAVLAQHAAAAAQTYEATDDRLARLLAP